MSESPEERMANNKLYSVDAFAAGIKAKHPQYKDIDNEELVSKMLDKYPQYRESVDYRPAGGWSTPAPETPKKKDSTDSTSTGEGIPSSAVSVSEAPQRDAFKIIDENPWELGRLWNRAIAGSETGKIAARSFYGGSIDFEELAYYNKVLRENAPKADDWLAAGEDKVVGSFLLDIVRTIPESLIGLIDASLSPEAAGSAAAGAAAGSAFTPIGTATGAAAGAAFAGSGMLTFGSTLLGKMSEAGIDITDADALEKAWNDTDFITPLAQESAAKAGIVGMFDAISAGIGGSVAKGAVKAGTKRVAAEIGEYAVEGGLGAAGEAIGSVAAGDEVNWRDVALEGLADPAAGITGRVVKSIRGGVEGKLDPAEEKMLTRMEEDETGFERKVSLSTVENAEKLKANKAQIEELNGALKTAPPKQRKTILKEIQKLQKENTEIHSNSLDAYDNLSEEEINTLGELAEDILELGRSLEAEDMTDTQKDAIKKVIDGKRAEIQAIRDAKPAETTEVTETEVPVETSVEEAPVEEVPAEQTKEETPTAEPTVEEIPAEQTQDKSEVVDLNGDQFEVYEDGRVVRKSTGRALKVGSVNYKAVVAKAGESKKATKKATKKKDKEAPVATPQTPVVETPAVEEAPAKKELTAAEKKSQERAVRITNEVPRKNYKSVQSDMVRTETGYSTVVEKKDKRSGKTRRYEGDVILDFKTGKVKHVITEYLDGKEVAVKEYGDVKSFRDAINKKIKSGAVMPEQFKRKYETQVKKAEGDPNKNRLVDFKEKEAPKEGRVVVEKVSYEAASGKRVEMKIQVNGRNRQRGLPYASVTYEGNAMPNKTFATKQQLDQFESQLARRKDVKTETISDTVRSTDQNKALQSEQLSYSEPILEDVKVKKSKQGTGKPKNMKPYTMSTYFQDQQIKIIQYRDKRGNTYLYQRLPDTKTGEFMWFEVEEKTLAGGVKRFEEKGRGYELKRDIVSELRKNDKEATPPTPPPTKEPKPKTEAKKPEAKKAAPKKTVKPPMDAPSKAEIEAKVKEAEKRRAMNKDVVVLDGKKYNVYEDGVIVNVDSDREIKSTSATGKKIVKELKNQKTEEPVGYISLTPEFIAVANRYGITDEKTLRKFDKARAEYKTKGYSDVEFKLLSKQEQSQYYAINELTDFEDFKAVKKEAEVKKSELKKDLNSIKVTHTKRNRYSLTGSKSSENVHSFEYTKSASETRVNGTDRPENGIGYLWTMYQSQRARKAFKNEGQVNANKLKKGDIVRVAGINGSQYVQIEEIYPEMYKDPERKNSIKEYYIRGKALLSTSSFSVIEDSIYGQEGNYSVDMDMSANYGTGATISFPAGRGGAYMPFKKFDVYSIKDAKSINLEGVLKDPINANIENFKNFLSEDSTKDNIAETLSGRVNPKHFAESEIYARAAYAILEGKTQKEIQAIQDKSREDIKTLESKSSIAEQTKEQTENQTDVKDGFTILETDNFKGENAVGVDKSTLLSKARAAVAVLKIIAPKANIRFVNTSQEFQAAMNKYDEAGANPLVEERGRAFTNKLTGEIEIYINLEMANPSVIAHEVFHVYFHKVANSSPELASDMATSISKMLKKGTKQEKALAKQLDRFVSNYDKNARPEEFLAELAGILSDNIQAITPTKLQQVVRAIKDMVFNAMKAIGLDETQLAKLFDTGIAEREDAESYLDFIESFAKTMNSYAFEYENAYPTADIIPTAAYMSDMTSRSSLLNNRLESYETKLGKHDAVISYEYLEDSVGRELLEKGYITKDHTLSEYKDKVVVMHQPDRAFTGSIKYKTVMPDGSIREEMLIKGQGGMYYPMRFFNENYVWASTEVAAKGMADKINASVKANGGKGYLVLVIGNQDKTFSSSVNITGVASLIGSVTNLPEFGLSEPEFISMIKESVKDSVNTKSNPKADRIKKYLLKENDPKKVMSAFQLLMNPEVTTFTQRKATLTKANGKGLISKLTKHIKSKGDDAILAWNALLGEKPILKTDGSLFVDRAMSISMLERGLLKVINEPIIQGNQLTGMAHMVIEVEGEVEAFRTDRKSDAHHGSYPFAIRAKNDGAVKMRLFAKNERPFEGNKVYDAGKGTEFAHINTKNINNVEELVKANFLNTRMSNTILPPTSGISETVIINPSKKTKKALSKEVPVNKESRKRQEEQYEAIKEMSPEEFKEYFILEKARSKAQSMSENNPKFFGISFTYAQRNKITKEMLYKTFKDGKETVSFIEYGKKKYASEYATAQKDISERGGKMESKSSLADEQSMIDQKFAEKMEGEAKPNLFAKLKARKGLGGMLAVLGEFAREKGLVYTDTQKKVREFLESMQGQLSDSAEKVRLVASRLRKLAKTPEQLELINKYVTESDPESKQQFAEQLMATPNGEKILALADSMRAMIDKMSETFLNDPVFDSLPEAEFKEVVEYTDKGKKKYKVINTKTGEALATDLTKAAATKIAEAPAIKDIIRANLGSYLQTSYKFFNSKKYKISDKAKLKAYRGEYEVAKMNEFKKMIESGMTEQEALAELQKPETINRLLDQAKESIDNYIKEIEALKDKEGFVITGISPNAIKIPKTSLQQKKGIPEHIQELLGVEKDPIMSFINTVMTQSRTIFKTQMVAKISKEFGGGFVKDSVTDAELNSGTWKKVNDPYSPINGKYVQAEIFEMLSSEPILQSENAILDAYFKGLKIMRKSKVVWNLPTWRKNLTGGVFFIAANGILNPRFAKDLKNRIDRTRKGESSPEIEQLLSEMAELGLKGMDVNAGLIDLNDAALNMMFDGDINAAEAHLQKVWNKLKNTDAKLAEKYAAIDDYTKLIIYRVERESFAKKLYGAEYSSLTEAQQKKVREAAGEFVKQNTPTFSRLPKWYIKSFSKVPLGDFLGFKLEAWRSITANIRNAVEDLKTAMNNKSLNEVQRAEYMSAGRRRLMGSIATLGARAIVPAILTSLFLGDEDDEIAEDALAIRPSWMEGHTLIVKDIADDGTVSVYNYSMEDPYGEITDVLTGDLGGLADFMNPNMFVKLAVHLTEGRDAYGRDLYDESDPVVSKLAKMLGYTTKSMIIPPSIASSAKYQENQMLIRDYKFNLGQQFYFAAREYTKGKPYNELSGRARTNRLSALDDVKTMYDSVMRVAQAKGNTTMMVNANKVLRRFGKIERAYIMGGISIPEQ